MHVNYAFTLDSVSLLSLGDPAWLTFSNVKVGFTYEWPFPHDFLLYLERHAEFTVNRFRTGGMGLTLSMDEYGLAEELAAMEANGPRILNVFRRLDEAHNSDIDEVAFFYVRRMRENARDVETLRRLKHTTPELIALLIKSLDEGWTTRGERECIEFLTGLN